MGIFLLLPSSGWFVSHIPFDIFLVFFLFISILFNFQIFFFISSIASFWISVMFPLVIISLSIIGYTLGDPYVWRAYHLSYRQIGSNRKPFFAAMASLTL